MCSGHDLCHVVNTQTHRQAAHITIKLPVVLLAQPDELNGAENDCCNAITVYGTITKYLYMSLSELLTMGHGSKRSQKSDLLYESRIKVCCHHVDTLIGAMRRKVCSKYVGEHEVTPSLSNSCRTH